MKVSSAPRQGNRELPSWLKDLISAPPRHGEGVHGWLFNVAKGLHAYRNEADIFALLSTVSAGCGRHVPDREITEAIKDAWPYRWQPGSKPATASKAAPKWPALNEAMRAEIIAQGFTLADLWDKSPTICTPDSVDAEFFADELFPENPLLCVGLDSKKFTTAPRESFRGKLGEMSLVVPSPMSAVTGKRKSDGKPSMHTLDNTGERHYLVTEFDHGTADEQAALIWHLREFAPLVLALSSGGKSIHAWWDCRGVAENITSRFFRYAVALGADPKIWSRAQFVRLPQGWRNDKQRRQEVYFFNHQAKGSI